MNEVKEAVKCAFKRELRVLGVASLLMLAYLIGGWNTECWQFVQHWLENYGGGPK